MKTMSWIVCNLKSDLVLDNLFPNEQNLQISKTQNIN